MKDDAVSSVIGAIMVMALLVVTMVTIQTQYEPVWELQKEIEQSDEALNAFARLKTDVDQQMVNGSRVPLTSPVPLGSRNEGRMWQTPGVRAQLAFEPDNATSNLSAPALDLFRADGRRLGILNEEWSLSSGNESVTGIQEIDSLRIRLTAPVNEKLELKKFSYVRLRITDANGDYAGEYRAYSPEKDKEDVWVRITTASGNILFDQEILADAKYKEHATMWLDALDPSIPFRPVLDAVQAPFTVDLGYDFPELVPAKWPDVEYAMSYTEVSPEGEELFIGGTGAQTISNFERNYAGGRIVYDFYASRMPSHTLVFEHGAVLRVQEAGAAMVIPPNIYLRPAGSFIIIDGTMPSLAGKEMSVDRVGSAGVNVLGTKATSFAGSAAQFTIKVSTAYPEAWAQYFRDLARDAGLADFTGYELEELPGSVAFTVKGTDGTSAHDLQISFRRAPVTVAFNT